jgi:hypothetical protein
VEGGFEIASQENYREIARMTKDRIQRGSIPKDAMLVVEEGSSDSSPESERNMIKMDLKKNRTLESFIHKHQKQ